MTRRADPANRFAALLGWLLVTAAVGIAVVGIALGGPGVGTAAAGDQLAAFSPVPHEVEADPGETVAVDVVVRSGGGHGGVGVGNVTLRASYDSASLAVTDVDPGTWLESDGAEVETETTVDDDRGVLEVRQFQDPPADGATGEDVFATLTVRVAADAPASNATIDFDGTTAELVDGTPLPTLERDATVSVGDGEAGAASREDDAGRGVAEAVPGSATVAGGLALLVLVATAVVAGRRRR